MSLIFPRQSVLQIYSGNSTVYSEVYVPILLLLLAVLGKRYISADETWMYMSLDTLSRPGHVWNSKLRDMEVRLGKAMPNARCLEFYIRKALRTWEGGSITYVDFKVFLAHVGGDEMGRDRSGVCMVDLRPLVESGDYKLS